MSEWRDRIPDMNDCTLPGRTGVMMRARTPSWLYWRLLDRATGVIDWMAITQPFERAAADLDSVWTMLPDKGVFIPNWVARLDRAVDESDRHWVHDPITLEEFKEIAPSVRRPTGDDLKGIVSPRRALTPDQSDCIAIERIVGKSVADRIAAGG